MPVRIDNPFVKRTFDQVDADRDGSIEPKEVKGHLGKIGVGAGLFGVVHGKATDSFMKTFDTNGDKKVGWDEFKGKAGELLPQSVRATDGSIDRTKGKDAFDKLDGNGDGKVELGEMKEALLAAMSRGTSHRSTKADISARLGVDALDADGDKAISAGEFAGALDHVDKLVRGEE